MQQSTKTAHRYLSTLLAGTSAWLLVMAILTHVQVPWAMADMYQQLASSGFQISWRWWLLFGLSLTLLVTLMLLGRVGHSGSADDRVFFGLLSLTVLWSAVLAMSGGGANAANAIQLILIAAAFMTLGSGRAWFIFALVTSVQILFLLAMVLNPHSAHASHDMGAANDGGLLHFVGMSVTFMLASLLLALTISHLQRSLQRQQREAQQIREAQLRQEQILAMGTASAQITHELATPLATIGLLYDELEELHPEDEAVRALAPPIRQVGVLLDDLRAVASQIQTQQQQAIALDGLHRQLQQQVSLHFSAAHVTWSLPALSHTTAASAIMADLTLVPALLGLIRNALEASAGKNVEPSCSIDVTVENDVWLMQIANPTSTEARKRLADYEQQDLVKRMGRHALHSDKGLGFGMVLSHATLERFQGDLRVQLDEHGVFTQWIRLPITHSDCSQPGT